MKHKIFIIVFSIALMFSFGSFEKVLACECFSRSYCETFGDSKAVFIGEVVEGNSPERLLDSINRNSNELKFVLVVRESFQGVEKHQQIPIYTGFGFGDCGFPFQKGESYLVYVYEENGKFHTSICSGSKHISRVSQEEFKFLENASKNRWKGAKVFGNVSVITHKRSVNLQTQDIKESIPFAKLKLSNGTETKYIQSDKNGNYEIDSLESKSYQLELLLPLNYTFDKGSYVMFASSQNWETRTFDLTNKGCKQEDFDLINDSRLSGKVTDLDRLGLAKATVQLIPINSSDKLTQEELYDTETNENGQFDLKNIPVGKYLLGINLAKSPDEHQPYQKTFYPGTTDRKKAAVINVELGQKISSLNFQATQKLIPNKVTGIVTYEDGKPASNISITLEDVNLPKYCVNGCNHSTDSQGRFELLGYQGYSYFVVAYDAKQNFVSNSPNFTLTKDLSGLKVTLFAKPKE